MLKYVNSILSINLMDEELENIKEMNDFQILENLCYLFDMYPVNDFYNLGNYEAGIDICYNGGSDYYTISTYDLRSLQAGKTITLYPLDDLYINEYLINDEE